MTIVFSHPGCLGHYMGEGHPERPARMDAVEQALQREGFDGRLVRRDAERAALDSIGLMHPQKYIDQIVASVPSSGITRLDADTCLSPGSLEAALRAVGAACSAVDAVVLGKSKNAFCAVRPPGHHAETNQAMGFSTHQMPLYPGTGSKSERGEFDNIVNCPLIAGDGSSEFRTAISDVILPALETFQPDLLLVSAGFDAHMNDPLAGLNLQDSDYAWVTKQLLEVADKFTNGRLISTLEGGYDLLALTSSVASHVEELVQA
jgi:acetoin utilization deacetylase AcuC-like enzyme